MEKIVGGILITSPTDGLQPYLMPETVAVIGQEYVYGHVRAYNFRLKNAKGRVFSEYMFKSLDDVMGYLTKFLDSTRIEVQR